MHRRCHNVLSARPFSEIDQPATLAAKREVGYITRDNLLADGALHFDLALASHGSILDRIDAVQPIAHWLAAPACPSRIMQM